MLPFLILCIGLIATGASTFYVAKTLQEKDQARFQSAEDNISDAIVERMNTHIALLRSAAGLLAAEERVSPEQFRAYTDRLQLREQYPTLEAIALAPAVTLAEKQRFEQEIKKLLKPDFQLFPPGERPFYFPLLYVAPWDSPCFKAIGYDLFSEATHYTAMTQARDTGNAAVSAKAIVARESEDDKETGFIVVVPVYHGGSVPMDMWERRRKLGGFICGIFRTDDLFSGIMPSEVAPLVHFRIHDGLFPNPDNVLYASPTEPSEHPRFSAARRFDLPGHIWTLQFEATPQFESVSNRAWGIWVPLFGLILSLALFVTTETLRRAKVVLARSNAELETRVQERTSRLQEMVSDLDHFTYSITHDMRAPLRAMQGYAQILWLQHEQVADDSASREYLHRIMVAAAQMDKLILDALDYTRVLRQEIVLSAVHPELVLKDCIKSYPDFQPPKADIQIQADFPLILANEAALFQCFSMLLGNAVKFVKPGTLPRVIVWAGKTDSKVTIFIRDNGIGIRREHYQRIFGMFQRLHTEHTYPGTGIGLAIVRKVAERMGAQVNVESEPGEGSTFYLVFKAYSQVEHRPASPAARTAENQSAEDPLLRRLLI